MNDERRPRKRSKTAAAFLPPELVWEIMARLPVKSLLRFRCICKAWRDTISDDASFRRVHLRAQTPRLLVWSSTHVDDCLNEVVTTVGLHAPSEESAALEDAMELSLEHEPHSISHCDGLLLVPTKTVVRVLNLATRRLLALPASSNSVAPASLFHEFLPHQVFGIGHDPRSNTYKVTRFFFGAMDPLPTGGYHHNFGMEVFTVGADQHWRETTAQPPYPARIIGGNGVFFEASLFWIIDESKLPEEESAPGFLRFRLEDESFGVTPPPPHCQGVAYETSYLAVLRGELSVAHAAGPKYDLIEIWMCDGVDTDDDPPLWNRRYVFKTFCILEYPFFEANTYGRCKNSLVRQVLKDVVGENGRSVDDHHLDLDCVIPYVPSLVPLYSLVKKPSL